MEDQVLDQKIYGEYSNYAGAWHQRISWAAVFAGLIVAIFVQLALTLLGVAIGMSTIDAVGHDTPGEGLAIGSGIWYITSMIISLFTGGWVAGRLAKDKHTSESMIHGVLVAGLLFILTFYFISNAVGSLMGGAGKILGSAVSSAAPSLKQAVEERYELGTNAGQAQMASDSAKVSDMIKAHKNEAEQKALKVADAAAAATGTGALYAFIGILLGTGAAAFGSKKGRDSKVPDDYGRHHQEISQSTRI